MANRNRYHPILVALEQNEKILRSPQTLLRVGIGVDIENVHRNQAVFFFFHRPCTWVNGAVAPITSSTHNIGVYRVKTIILSPWKAAS